MMMDDGSNDGVVDDFANRLKFEFEERGSEGDGMDEDQDWFVNDERSPSPTKSDHGGSGGGICESSTASAATAGASPLKASASSPLPFKAAGTDVVVGATKTLANATAPMKKSNSAPTVNSDVGDDYGYGSCCKTSFLHYFPPAMGILVMEVGQSDDPRDMAERRYGNKYFKFYLPQVHDAQTEFCLFARKRVNKNKYRFSLSEYATTKWNSNPFYCGKVAMTTSSGSGGPTAQTTSRKFKLAVPKNAARVQFDIDQETRKQELVVRLNPQSKGFNLFRGRSASTNDASSEFRSLVQKFINPVVDVRCPKSNDTLLKLEKEGDVGYEKYIITYARPLSLFVSCCIAVGVEAHLLD